MGQLYSFAIAETALAEAAGVSMYDLHTNVDAMCRVCDCIAPLAERLGVDPPAPHLAGFTYAHVSALGCDAEPEDYLGGELIRSRLALAAELKRRRPDAAGRIGHDFEGPITTAALMMGQSFFLLPYDDPARAHTLLDFVARSAVNCAKAIRTRYGEPPTGGFQALPDDFAGMFGPDRFAEFVVPYWNRIYEGLGAGTRWLHSELLREGHLKHLPDIRLDTYDPGVNQYQTPEILQRCCPCEFTLRIWPSAVRDQTAEQIVETYRRYASFHPTSITFGLQCLDEEPKAAALLAVARELA